jgi:hypothetical protein
MPAQQTIDIPQSFAPAPIRCASQVIAPGPLQRAFVLNPVQRGSWRLTRSRNKDKAQASRRHMQKTNKEWRNYSFFFQNELLMLQPL